MYLYNHSFIEMYIYTVLLMYLLYIIAVVDGVYF